MSKISIIVAVAENNAIGLNNKLLYWLPNDLKRFKAITTGHTIIMGRKTFESLPKGALPNRRNIVLSRNLCSFEGAEHYNSLDEAIKNCNEEDEVFIIGGASLYKDAYEMADCLYITEINDTPDKADSFFPEIDKEKWKEESRETYQKDEKHPYSYSFVKYNKV